MPGWDAAKKGMQQQRAAVAAKPASRMKVISMGDEAVGKSCLIKRYCEEKFVNKHVSTIGIDFGVKPVVVQGQTMRVNFWDLAGGDEYLEIRNEFYKDTQGAVLVYDVSDRRTFENLERWLKEASEGGASSPQLAVCANKIDGKRCVTEAEGKKWAAKHKALYFETSAKDGDGVKTMFEGLFKQVVTSQAAAAAS